MPAQRPARFRAVVEPPEPMRGLEVPVEIVDALDGGKRPRVTVTLNGHSWKTRIAILRGRDVAESDVRGGRLVMLLSQAAADR